jgi:TRAP transporter 4TM/12TM fusion protein
MLLINNAFNFFPFNQIPFVNFMGNLPPQIHRSSFVALLLLYTFLLFPAGKRSKGRVNHLPWYDLLFGVAGAASFLYHTFNFHNIVAQRSMFTETDFVVAVVGIVILFIACYRVVGLPLLVVVWLFLGYALFGQHIPGIFGHAGYRVERVFTYLFYTPEGVIGTPIGVTSTFIFMFLLFSAFLMRTGVSALFIDVANIIAGRAVGGPAKVSVVVSALEGMVSGSSIANTVASGSFTIPLMKRLGYEKNFAGAVEAAASTGGQILPPILGAAAFLMAEITGIPFRQIALAALIPAILYFATVFASVHFEAKKVGLRPVPEDEIPELGTVVVRIHLLLPFIALILFLISGTTLAYAALYATVVGIIVSMFRKDTRLNFTRFFDAMEAATKNVIGVAVACGVAGMIVGVVTLTGLGMTFSNAMISLADGIGNETIRMVVILFLCMLASILLGLGVPTTAKYLIMAFITAPIIVSLGIPVLAAHMFVFFCATDADITPPVGLAGYAAAAISGGTPMRTCILATKLAIADFIIPFSFATNPQMLFIDATFIGVLLASVTGLIGIIGVAAGLSGYLAKQLNGFERIILIAAGIAMINHNIISNIIGGIIIIGMFIGQRIYTNKKATLLEV